MNYVFGTQTFVFEFILNFGIEILVCTHEYVVYTLVYIYTIS